MSAVLSSDCLTVNVATKGAEIKSIVERSTGIEYIWQSDPAFWTGAAPILFPIIGGLKNNAYTYRGQQFSMPSHGIVRKKEWEQLACDGTTASFRTVADADTKKVYPFDFDLRAIFALAGNRLAVTYEVNNTGSDLMYFSIGSHPAFRMPFAGGYIENYYYHFSESETIERHFFMGGLHSNRTAPVFDNSRQIWLSRTLFEDGAVILKNPKSKEISLRNSRNSKQVKVITDGMPFLGLWGAPECVFACIEPWYGVMDGEDADGDFTKKEGIIELGAKGTYSTTYRIEIT